jgi:archaemetzincin
VRAIQILPFGKSVLDLARRISTELAKEFSVPCETAAPAPDPSYAFDPARQQYYSTQILAELATRPLPKGTRLLGIVSSDLFIPILTFVFGEAQLNGACAVVSTFRLRQEFYGLPANLELLHERLLKESAHELGHTLGMPHCDDYNCVMAPSHGVEWIDLKKSSFCQSCRMRMHVWEGLRP